MVTETTDLNQILSRLQAMMKSVDSDIQERRFITFGIEVVHVLYNRRTDLWVVSERKDGRQFIFDDIDLVAIEVFDTIHDVSLMF